MISKLRASLSDLWNIAGDSEVSDEKLIDLKANQLHVFMLAMIFVLCFVYTMVGIVMSTPEEAIATAIPMPVVLILYFGFYRNNFKLVSKVGAVLITLGAVAVLTMINGIPNGELAFIIPIMVGTQIVLQGKERKYSYLLLGIIILVTLYVLFSEQRIHLTHPNLKREAQIEYLLNYIGAAIATVFQVGFLILVNERLQRSAFHAAQKLRELTESLTLALNTNNQQNLLIKSQMEDLQKTGLELKKLSLIATMTGNGVIIADAQGRIEWVNKAFEKISGFTLNEVKGRKPKDFLQRGDEKNKSVLIAEKLARKEYVGITILNYTKDNRPYHNQLEITPIFDEKGVHTHFISIQRDITNEINYLNEIERLKNNYEQVVAEVTNDYIWEWDLKGDKIVLGRDLEDVFDPKPGGNGMEYIWKLESLHPDDQQKLLELRKSKTPTRTDKFQMEYRYMDKKGNYRIFFDRALIRFDEHEKPLNVIGAIADVTEQRRIEAELVEQKLKEQKLLTKIALQSQEKEKNKIAYELHENINQILAAAKMYIDHFKSEHNTNDRFLEKGQNAIDNALNEIRKISHSLAAPFESDHDLMDAIRELMAPLGRETIVFSIHNDLPDQLFLPEEIKLMIYRIVQEQVNNILAHSKATEMCIAFFLNENGLNFCVKDNGMGFDPSVHDKGVGLRIIESRITLFGGTMEIGSHDQGGCQLRVCLPI